MNKSLTFITGNQTKADYLARHIKFPIDHHRVELEEIQSLNLEDVAEHKARQAYAIVNSPVLVEDVSLVFEGLGKLPGPFIKWFEAELGPAGLCRLVDSLETRKAISRVCFVYFDGQQLKFFNGQLEGTIADKPRGEGGFGFDPIFIINGFQKTVAEMTEAEKTKHSLRPSTVYPQIREFLASLDKID